jgi:hypothetical protein
MGPDALLHIRDYLPGLYSGSGNLHQPVKILWDFLPHHETELGNVQKGQAL